MLKRHNPSVDPCEEILKRHNPSVDPCKEITYSEIGSRTIAVDFDHTLHNGTYPDFNPPNPDVVDGIRKLKAQGWRILIYTARICDRWFDHWYDYPEIAYNLNYDVKCAIKRYLEDYNIPFDDIWTGKGKPYCRYYIDDAAIEYKPGTMDQIVERIGAINES
jgi:hypothetical protein